ncbi:MAG: TIGR04552 family protein [Halobacteriovoraceae bacterium]|jgi:uncharacterized protein (TIGR04562 family)|nr:TIGR04552 family protein [Halobacteriovoraceae bacterium]
MSRPDYLTKYLFDWELLDVVLGGQSSLDSKFFISQIFNENQVSDFLKGYGLDPGDPIGRAELFGNFQEALQFIKRYFLKEGNPDGLDLKIPSSIFMITDIGDLFLMATGNLIECSDEDTLWAEIILKVMHTILHVDKDLRSNYFSVTQTQILDRYYKFIHRDGDKNLYLGAKGSDEAIPLIDFETKSKKSRESVIIKLLHKAENVAEELFDRIGIRLITNSRFDTLRVIKFLIENHIVIPHNLKPSRSSNTLINLEVFKEKHNDLIKMSLRNNLKEKRFLQAMERELIDCFPQVEENEENKHSLSSYRSIQFTCRQLIKYKNPFLQDFNDVRRVAKAENDENQLAKKVLALDVSLISRDIRFFYPYEIQIVDQEAHAINTKGEASHGEYKKAQVRSAMRRVFGTLISYKGIEL